MTMVTVMTMTVLRAVVVGRMRRRLGMDLMTIRKNAARRVGMGVVGGGGSHVLLPLPAGPNPAPRAPPLEATGLVGLSHHKLAALEIRRQHGLALLPQRLQRAVGARCAAQHLTTKPTTISVRWMRGASPFPDMQPAMVCVRSCVRLTAVPRAPSSSSSRWCRWNGPRCVASRNPFVAKRH